jgi:hypothetical protein
MLILRGEQGVLVNVNQVCVCLHSATFSSDLDGRVFLCGQDAETVRQPKRTVVGFIWFVSFVWLSETYEMNQIIKTNQINPTSPARRGWPF